MRTKFSKDKLETLHKPAPSRTNAPMEISRPWERSQVESVAAGELLLFGANLYLLSLYNCVFLSLRFFFSYSQHARLGQICSSARTCSKIIKQNWRLLQNLTLSLHIPPSCVRGPAVAWEAHSAFTWAGGGWGLASPGRSWALGCASAGRWCYFGVRSGFHHATFWGKNEKTCEVWETSTSGTLQASKFQVSKFTLLAIILWITLNSLIKGCFYWGSLHGPF